MNDIDRNVETVLRGLRDAQPDASLEQRIAQALQAEPPASESRYGFRGWAFAWRVAGSAVLGVAIVSMLLHLRQTPRPQEATDLATRTPPAIVPRPERSGAEAVQQQGVSVIPHAVSHRMARAQAQAARPEEPPSFPAPELPLTEQERLLLRLTHRDDPVQLARLAPGPRAARYQAEKDAVSEFFKPPEQQPEPTVVEPGGGTQ